MGIAVGGNKGGPVSDPNIVPLIDVLLVLIIIFMVITPKIPTGLPTAIPESAPASNVELEPNTIVVQVMEGGKLLINRDQSDWNTLGPALSDIFKQRADKVAFVKGDDKASFAEIARAIDIMRGAGVDRVGLMPIGMVPSL
jgi:biopolymer transport protein TolR